MPRIPNIAHRLAAPMLAALIAAILPGCGAIGIGGGSVTRLDSAEYPVRLQPTLPTKVHHPLDAQSADIYLTDLPEEILDDADALGRASGQIIHVHMFVRPRPGRTPIQETACTATVRYIVLAEGRVGVYAGGGFLFPRGKTSGSRFSGSMDDATVRLVAAGPGFVDRIGSGLLDVGFSARQDADLAPRLARLADRLALSADPVRVTTLAE